MAEPVPKKYRITMAEHEMLKKRSALLAANIVREIKGIAENDFLATWEKSAVMKAVRAATIGDFKPEPPNNRAQFDVTYLRDELKRFGFQVPEEMQAILMDLGEFEITDAPVQTAESDPVSEIARAVGAAVERGVK